MIQYMTLMGAEAVTTAASTMKAAASEMSAAASSIEETARRQREFLDEWLGRLEIALNGHTR